MKNIYKTQNKLLGFAIFLGFSLFFTSSTALAFSGEGVGTSDDPYQITDCSEWLEMSSDLDADYALDGDIDCTGVTYTPIGTSGSKFTGSLNGNGWEISGVSITSGTTKGLFGYIDSATIKNLYFASSTISAGSWIGGIAADARDGTISNVHSTVDITATGGSVGGLVGIGHDALLIEKSSYNGTISAGNGYVGGVIARLEGNLTVNDSYAIGTIGSPAGYVGGFAGAVLSGSPTISRSYAAMTFTGVDTYNGGFIGGFFGGTVIDSFSASDMTVEAGTLSGGMFGVGDGTSTNNYFDKYLADRSGCTGNGAAACTGVNDSNGTPNYFKNNSTNAPLDEWNFTTPWVTASGNYPQFSQIATGVVSCELPTSTKTTLHLFCDVTAVGSLGTVTWAGRYRVEGASSWTSFTLADSSTGTMDISSLDSGTTYEISLRYISSIYGDGLWANTEVTTKQASGDSGGGSSNNDSSDSSSTSQSSNTNTGYGPVNENIFLASSKKKTTSSGGSADKDKTTPTAKSPLKSETIEQATDTLRNILLVSGGVVFLALFINLFKPPTPTASK